jgi:hypothetical protein
MNFPSSPARLISAVLLTCAATASHAAMTLTTLTGANTATTYFNSLTNAKGTDTYEDLTLSDGQDALGTSLARNAGAIGYTVTTETNFYAVQVNGIGGPGLSVENNTDTLTFDNFNAPGPVYAFGARFFLSDLSYGVNSGTMTVIGTEVGGATQTFTFNQNVNASTGGATEPVFFRLGSTVGLQSVKLVAPLIQFDTDGNPLSTPFVFGTVDNVVVGAVPLPAAGWLLISGLGAMGFLKRRRS